MEENNQLEKLEIKSLWQGNKLTVMNYIFSILIIGVIFFCVYSLITLPILFVFIIDDAVSGSEIITSYLGIMGISMVWAFVLAIPNILFDYLKKFNKLFDWIIPLSLLLTINISVFFMDDELVIFVIIFLFSIFSIVFRILIYVTIFVVSFFIKKFKKVIYKKL